MIPQYCSKRHENPPGSRFCLRCGEKLDLSVSKGIQSGLLLGDRYRIVRQLGQGGFGRTYLAEDTNRFSEYCVLKEFAPQAQGTSALQKAEEMFEREAGVLYKLQHPQIPSFRELFRVNLDGKGYFFLVQDYVEGQTYQALLNIRKQQGMKFNEVEVTQLLLQILPVLEYIHSMGVIHRDISPDNLILRSSDYLPVLIDFGGVKQVAATVASRFNQASASPATLLGKVGYAPSEQMVSGIVYPHSDLYALAATVLVLLSGKEPQELIDDNTLSWNWQREFNLSPTLGAVLDKMLSQRTSDRYQSARQALQALTGSNFASSYATAQPSPDMQATLAIAPFPHHSVATNPQQAPMVTSTRSPTKPSSSSFPLGKILLVFLLLLGAVGMGWWGGNLWLQSYSNQDEITLEPRSPDANSSEKPPVQFSPEEQNRKDRLRDHRQQLGINNKFYIELVDQFFWDKYPNQRGRNLSTTAQDAELRAEWDKTAGELLDKLQQLSPEARRKLGTYTAQDRVRQKVAVNKLHLSSRALYDLADAAFWQLFPQQQGKNFIEQPIGQVWHTFADEKLKAIIAGTAFERILFEPGANSKQVSGNVKPGEGKAYIAELAKEQLMKLDLQANPQVKISVYSPTGKILLEDSKERTLSTTLAEKGFYEFVIVSTAGEPIDYQLNLRVENAIVVPIEPSLPETATPSPSPREPEF